MNFDLMQEDYCGEQFAPNPPRSRYVRGSERAGRSQAEWKRFPGIVEFAALHGVDRIHAWYVLTGKRESRRLLAAWQQFKAKQGKAA